MAAFERALAAGADGVELDVQRSADRVPVVIHDDTLRRTRHGSGRVADRTAAELTALRGRGEPIPTLAEAAAWAARTQAWLNVEIKATDVTAETLDVLRDAGLRERVILSSFHADVVSEIGRRDPRMKRYLLLEKWSPRGLEAVVDAGAQGVCLGVAAAEPATLAQLRGAGLPVVVWTVDDPARIAGLLAAGVEGIITNRPRIAAALRT